MWVVQCAAFHFFEKKGIFATNDKKKFLVQPDVEPRQPLVQQLHNDDEEAPVKRTSDRPGTPICTRPTP